MLAAAAVTGALAFLGTSMGRPSKAVAARIAPPDFVVGETPEGDIWLRGRVGPGMLNQFAKAEPLKALALLVLMFSLAGVPPMVGFFGKFYVLKAAVDAGMTGVAVAGAVASVIGAFYYLRIVYFMYFGKDGGPVVESRMAPVQWVMLVAVAAVMVLGVVNLFGIEPPAALAAEALVR